MGSLCCGMCGDKNEEKVHLAYQMYPRPPLQMTRQPLNEITPRTPHHLTYSHSPQLEHPRPAHLPSRHRMWAVDPKNPPLPNYNGFRRGHSGSGSMVSDPESGRPLTRAEFMARRGQLYLPFSPEASSGDSWETVSSRGGSYHSSPTPSQRAQARHEEREQLEVEQLAEEFELLRRGRRTMWG